jgi:hypothetical protein
MRDVRLVGGKLKVVLMPRNTSDETLKALRDCACPIQSGVGSASAWKD